MTRTAAEDQQAWNRYWTRWAAEYDEHQLSRLSLPGEREAWSRAFGDTLPPGTREVLDLGTGSGNVALLLAADGYDVTGIDLSSGMLAQARAKVESHPHPPTFLEADAADPPFPRGSMDAIVSRYLLWTLRDAPTALRRWHELLRPGGVLVAVDGQWFEPEDDGGAASATARQEHFAEAYDKAAVDHLDFARAGGGADLHGLGGGGLRRRARGPAARAAGARPHPRRGTWALPAAAAPLLRAPSRLSTAHALPDPERHRSPATTVRHTP